MEFAAVAGGVLVIVGEALAQLVPLLDSAGHALAALGFVFAYGMWLRFALARCPRCDGQFISTWRIVFHDALGQKCCRRCGLRSRD